MARCAGEALLAAVEIYNKPTVNYRDQTFAFLMTNAWEVLLKARLLQMARGRVATLYRREPDSNRYVRDSTTREPLTISLREAIGRANLPGPVVDNCRGLMAIRNQATHLGILQPTVRQMVLRFGTAGVQNFIKLSSQWFGNVVEVPYLLLVGFVGPANLAQSRFSTGQKELLTALQSIAQSSLALDEAEFAVVMQIDIQLNRGLSGGGSIGLTNDPRAPRVQITDDEALKQFPTSYDELVSNCRERYSDFKLNARFHEKMKTVNGDPRCVYERKLDPTNERSSKKRFYNLATCQGKLDDEYAKAQ